MLLFFKYFVTKKKKHIFLRTVHRKKNLKVLISWYDILYIWMASTFRGLTVGTENRDRVVTCQSYVTLFPSAEKWRK